MTTLTIHCHIPNTLADNLQFLMHATKDLQKLIKQLDYYCVLNTITKGEKVLFYTAVKAEGLLGIIAA